MKIAYCQAYRCWQSNNLKSCARLCSSLSKSLSLVSVPPEKFNRQLVELKHSVWFLKVRCLAEDYHINESFLLNEADIQSDDQVQTYNATAATATGKRAAEARPTTAQSAAASRHKVTAASGTRMDTRGQRTGMVTGRMASRNSSKVNGQATTSYRPLTTSLTATQTAFSRSTRPLLKYSTNRYLSKPIYEYLYNTQNITNICPDYRQCLEYLNLVQSSRKKPSSKLVSSADSVDSTGQASNRLINLSSEQIYPAERRTLDAYWSLAFGICYFHLKIQKHAEEFFQLSASANRKYLDPYLWLIKIYLRLNQPTRVLKTCDEAASQNSRNAILYNWKARVQSLLGDHLAAHASLRDSLQFCPTNIEALANVAHYSFYGDKLELALKCFERINQLSMNTGSSGPQASGPDGILASTTDHSNAELFNNLALCHFQCGDYAQVMPLFQKAFLNSPNKEVTSNIWYNLSFVPLSFGSKQLAIACLQLALKNDSQNEEATNNLGVLKYDSLLNDPLHYRNRQEYWSLSSSKSPTNELKDGLTNGNDQRRLLARFDDAETFFCNSPIAKQQIERSTADSSEPDAFLVQPEMLHNMAIVKRKRGQMLASVKYCDLYLQYDQNNQAIRGILSEINELVSHDC